MSSGDPLKPIYKKYLSGLDDVRVTALANGETLVYDETHGYWKNTTLGEATGSVTTDESSTSKILPTVGFSGESAGSEANGGLELTKNFVAQNGPTYEGNFPPGAYSQAVTFGDKEVNGSWRMAAVQRTNGTPGTVLSFEKLIAGVWTPQYTIG